MKPRIGSLFSGYAGLDMAVEAVTGGETVWVSDIDPGANKILAHHWPDVPNLGDISAVDWDSVQPVDILTGGFPCQDVSMAGIGLGLRTGTRSGLWAIMAGAIDSLRPDLVVIENVKGLLNAPAYSDLELCAWCMGDAARPHMRALGAVLGDLASIGYDAEWTSNRASDIGAPHHRSRVFITAYPQGIGRGKGNPYRNPEPAAPAWQGYGNPGGSLGDVLRRWGRIVGRPHPEPLRTGQFAGNAANPLFWEWLMGLPEGHVTGVPGLTHREQIKAVGNGVVPQQAEHALRHLLAAVAA